MIHYVPYRFKLSNNTKKRNSLQMSFQLENLNAKAQRRKEILEAFFASLRLCV
jgi:hypothetical protein